MHRPLTSDFTIDAVADPKTTRLDLRQSTVLVIDDDIAFRTLVQAFLKDTSHRVIQASDGVEGMALLSCQPVDVLITDIVMPEQEGLSTILKAHREFPELKIIAVSGVQAGSGYLRTAKKFGAHVSLPKPITREGLLEALRSVVEW